MEFKVCAEGSHERPSAWTIQGRQVLGTVAAFNLKFNLSQAKVACR